MEGIAELRQICRGPSPAINLYDRLVIHPLSIRATWLLLHSSISANGVTLLAILAGLPSGLFLARLEYWAPVLGALLLQVHHVLDASDGEVARYRKSSSPVTGTFLDALGHNLINGSIVAGLTLHMLARGGGRLELAGGFVALTSFALYTNLYGMFLHSLSQAAPAEEDGSKILRAPALHGIRSGQMGKAGWLQRTGIFVTAGARWPYYNLIVLAGALAGRLDLAFWYFVMIFPLQAGAAFWVLMHSETSS